MQEELERVPEDHRVDLCRGGGDEDAGDGGEADGQGGSDGLAEEGGLRVARVAGPVCGFTYSDFGGYVEAVGMGLYRFGRDSRCRSHR